MNINTIMENIKNAKCLAICVLDLNDLKDLIQLLLSDLPLSEKSDFDFETKAPEAKDEVDSIPEISVPLKKTPKNIKVVQYSYLNLVKDFSRITRKNGTGFILYRLLELGEATKNEVYGIENGIKNDRNNCTWAILLNSGLIECTNGYRKPSVRARFGGYTNCYATYTYKKEPARYCLTELGKELAETL